MLLLHEVHRVAGAKEDAFDEAYRDELIPALAKSDGSRLLWYLRLSHGSGQAYTIVTITGCRDAVYFMQQQHVVPPLCELSECDGCDQRVVAMPPSTGMTAPGR